MPWSAGLRMQTTEEIVLTGQSPKTEDARQRRRTWIILTAVWILAAVAVLPVVFHWKAAPPRHSRTEWAIWLTEALTVLICFLIYRAELCRHSPRQAIGVALMAVFVTCVVVNTHNFYIDNGQMFPDITNHVWQQRLQNDVVNLVPLPPHNYRFLPNGIVRWMEMGHVPFITDVLIYRFITGLCFFYALYRLARLFVNYAGAMLAMLFVAAVFPISYEYYAGQLTDPLSHLSFVLGCIFLATGNFPMLLTTLLVGTLAKESVLALVGFYVLFCRRQANYLRNSVTLCVTGAVMLLGVRYLVGRGNQSYGRLVGFIVDNVTDSRWPLVWVLTSVAGAFVFFLAWKRIPLFLKQLYFYLLIVLSLANLIMGWAREARNYMPTTFVLAVVVARAFMILSESTESVDVADGGPPTALQARAQVSSAN